VGRALRLLRDRGGQAERVRARQLRHGWRGITGKMMEDLAEHSRSLSMRQAPVGFWDPMGFCENGDVKDYKRRREVEKRGRVAGCAAVGFIVPECFSIRAASPRLLVSSSRRAERSGRDRQGAGGGLAAVGRALRLLRERGERAERVRARQLQRGGWRGITGKSMKDPAKRSRSLNPEVANIRLVRFRS
jgi:hypothetical protein